MVVVGLAAIALPASALAAELQVRSRTGYQTNRVEFRRVEYVGQCPGIDITSGTLRGEFISEETPPAPGRRVRIQNVTRGMSGDPYPFTDREYSRGNASEAFEFGIDDRHRGQTFSVLAGENELEYEIYQDNRVIEEGTFAIDVAINDVGVFPRAAICSDSVQCREEEIVCGKNDDGSRRRGTRERCFTVTDCECPR
jgi:hypothetical protein